MKFKIIRILIIIGLFNLNVKAQHSNDIGLGIGDTLPFFKIPKMIHFKNSIGNTAEYKNKLLIIDFWATTCGGCIVSLPRLENLEEQFDSKLCILPVTDESKDKILNFWKSNPYTKYMRGGTVVEDRQFNMYFKHKYIPHEVWVYKGKVIGITSMEYVDAFNIRKVLNGEEINWPVKNDFYFFDRDKPLFTLNSEQINPLFTPVQYTAISDFRNENNSPIWLSGGSGIKKDSINKTVRVFFLNQPILNSYLMYWGRIIESNKLVKPYFSFQPNQVIWEVDDKSRYMFESKLGVYSPDWLIKNGICFESVYPDTGQNDKQIFHSAISDLDRLLGLKVRWEKRDEKVLILKRNMNKHTYPIKNKIKSQKYSIFEIFTNLNMQPNNPYVFNESGDEEAEISLEIKSWTNIDEIGKQLNNAGLELKVERREVDKLIFTEIDGGRLINRDLQEEEKTRKKGQENLNYPNVEENQSFLNNNKYENGVIQLPSGLQYKVLQDGTGIKPLANSNVLIHYEGRLVNGKIFDSSYENGISTKINVDGVIKGLSEALLMMSEGAFWELYIPSSLSYGIHTGNGKVPQNSTLIFKVKLIKVLSNLKK